MRNRSGRNQSYVGVKVCDWSWTVLPFAGMLFQGSTLGLFQEPLNFVLVQLVVDPPNTGVFQGNIREPFTVLGAHQGSSTREL